MPKRFLAVWATTLTVLAWTSHAVPVDFLLSDPSNPSYYRFAVLAGDEVSVVGATRISGDVHSNGDVRILPRGEVAGDLSAVGEVQVQGSVSGRVTEGAEPVPLPVLATEETLRGLAHRIVEGDLDLVAATVEEVLFVAGSVHVRGALGGGGTIIATGDILFAGEAPGGPVARPPLSETHHLSLIAFRDIRLDAGRRFRGALYAGRDVDVRKDIELSGVIVAAGRVRFDKSSSITFEDLDPVAPEITLESPADGSFLAEPAPTLHATWSDDFSGVDPATGRLLLDGEDRTGDSEIDAVGLAFTPAEPLADGDHPLTLSVRDHSDNEAMLAASFAVDTTPPELAILSPEDGGFVATDTVQVTGTAEDAVSGVERVEVNGVTATLDGTDWSVEVQLEGTAATLVATAVDRVGHAATARIEVILALPPLDLAITEPARGVLTAEAAVQVSGTVSELAQTVTVNDVEAVVDGGIFTASAVPLHEGANLLVAVARNSAGATGTSTVTVVRDTTPPSLRIESPTDGLQTSEPMVTVAGAVLDPAGGTTGDDDVTVVCNGVAGTVDNRAFLVADVPLPRGASTVSCTATDRAGNSAESLPVEVIRQALLGQRIERVSGNHQIAEVGAELPEPLVVRLVDGAGDPVPGRRVGFRVSRGSGVLVDSEGAARELEVLTDAEGRAAARFRLGSRSGPGSHRVSASATGFAGEIEHCATALPGAADRILAIAGENQRGVVGTPLARPLLTLVVDAAGNPLAGVPVTFEVSEGGGGFAGETSRTVITDGDGRAAARLTLGPEPGVNGNVVQASFPGLTGLPATFVASGLAAGRPQDTRVSGVVLDNADQPIPGARVLLQETSLETSTDNQGRFSLVGAPVGKVILRVNGATTPRPEIFPALEFELVTVAGRDNTVGMPIRIPALDPEAVEICGGEDPCTLSMAGVPGFEVTISPGAVTFADGSREGPVSLTQVPLDQVPMPPPDGSVFLPAWTLQPAGTHFDPPAGIRIPNTAGLAPGEQAEIFQFDHDLGEFVSIGPGTVAEDGSVVVSDPGFGITKAGWGGFRPPPPPVGSARGKRKSCPVCQQSVGGTCVPEPDHPLTGWRTLPSLQPPIGPGQKAADYCQSIGGQVASIFGVTGSTRRCWERVGLAFGCFPLATFTSPPQSGGTCSRCLCEWRLRFEQETIVCLLDVQQETSLCEKGQPVVRRRSVSTSRIVQSTRPSVGHSFTGGPAASGLCGCPPPNLGPFGIDTHLVFCSAGGTP